MVQGVDSRITDPADVTVLVAVLRTAVKGGIELLLRMW